MCTSLRVREAYRIAVCGWEGARIPLRGILAPSSLSLVRPSQSTQLTQSTTYCLAAGNGQAGARIPRSGILAPPAHLQTHAHLGKRSHLRALFLHVLPVICGHVAARYISTHRTVTAHRYYTT